MRRTLDLIVALSMFYTAACGQVDASARVKPPPAPREFRAAWVATVDNIDWPSRKGLPVDKQQAELVRILDRAVELRLNALIFQVRPSCDAMYYSRHEPWSEWLTGKQGQPPQPLWDPLEFAIAGARDRGLELHAWFNPFRARHQAATSVDARDHVSRTRGLCVEYADQLWLDPGLPPARDHTLRVIFDVVERYDIDGVHIDDYFYPYPVNQREFPDDVSFGRYRDGGGALSRNDWRRQNVNTLVERLYDGIKARKPWVKFGISPFGIARPGVPSGIEAGLDQFGHLYADVAKWLDEGWCDYIAPQLYWKIAPRAQSYPVLLSWWARANVHSRHLWVGNYSSQTIAKQPWSAAEILNQIRLTRDDPRATGNIHFSVKALQAGKPLGRVLEVGPYVEPALVPASTWLDAEPPRAPELTVTPASDGGVIMRWPEDPDVRWRSVYLKCSGRWRMIQVLPGSKPGMRLTVDNLRSLRVSGVGVAAVDRCGNESDRVLRALP